MTEILSYILGFLVLIMVITAVHEAGHFYIAKLFKVKILDSVDKLILISLWSIKITIRKSKNGINLNI